MKWCIVSNLYLQTSRSVAKFLRRWSFWSSFLLQEESEIVFWFALDDLLMKLEIRNLSYDIMNPNHIKYVIQERNGWGFLRLNLDALVHVLSVQCTRISLSLVIGFSDL
uniref:Uncharacterized protein n=1 Tax=Opuntia streptacantha TaxID=393608 RepID=A0A7C9EYP5_OPUST